MTRVTGVRGKDRLACKLVQKSAPGRRGCPRKNSADRCTTFRRCLRRVHSRTVIPVLLVPCCLITEPNIRTVMSLNLILLQPLFTVCRFPRQSSSSTKILSWIHQQLAAPSSSDSSKDASFCSFLSITQTADELSIVCRQDLLSSSSSSSSTQWSVTAMMTKMERDWSCFKVQGPLDFGLTGILASLANPLAKADIPIFAVSTYDTDYLLVKVNKLQQAITILTGEGHSVVTLKEEQEEKQGNRDTVVRVDPPSTSLTSGGDGPIPAFVDEFEADPITSRLLEGPQKIVDPKKQQQQKEQTFGLVAVVGWPPDRNQMLESYQRFRTAVELCFDEDDVSPTITSYLGKDSLSLSPAAAAVYLYPFQALHVTVTSPYDLRRPLPESEQAKTSLTEQWRCVIDRATQKAAWPRNPLQLEIDSAQIGSKAGILLWKETTGNLQAMRECIQSTADEMKEELEHNGVSTDTLTVPSIVHTTMLRFHREPKTPVEIVQERFARQVLPRLHEFFPARWQVDTFTLVCEQMPYMHIPADDKHIVYQCSLK